MELDRRDHRDWRLLWDGPSLVVESAAVPGLRHAAYRLESDVRSAFFADLRKLPLYPRDPPLAATTWDEDPPPEEEEEEEDDILSRRRCQNGREAEAANDMERE